MADKDFSTPYRDRGRLLGATVVVPDIKKAEAAYAAAFRFRADARGKVDDELAALWDAPAVAGQPWTLMAPAVLNPTWVRLIEVPGVVPQPPLTTHGWVALEIAVEDVEQLHDAVVEAGFEILGPPQDREFSGPVRPMQCAGPGGEAFFLTEIHGDAKHYCYPRPRAWVDQLFIAILSAPDRRAGQAFYESALRFQFAADYEMTYGSLNRAFGLPEETLQCFTMIKAGHRPAVQIDVAPPAAAPRPVEVGALPSGLATVSVFIPSLDTIAATFSGDPVLRTEAPYNGHRVATIRGSAGELLELVECGD